MSMGGADHKGIGLESAASIASQIRTLFELHDPWGVLGHQRHFIKLTSKDIVPAFADLSLSRRQIDAASIPE